MEEEWRDVEGYEGKYKISNWGNIKSLSRMVYSYNGGRCIKEKMLKPWIDRDGYLGITLNSNGKKRYYSMHRLVAKAYIPNTENLPEVNHIDGNKKNNKVDNLEWCNHQYNIKEAYRLNLIPKHNPIITKRIVQYDKNNNFIREWQSIVQAEKELKIHNQNICACLKGRTKTCGGYIWRYVKEDN